MSMFWTSHAVAKSLDLTISLRHITSLLHVAAHLTLIQFKLTEWTFSKIVDLDGPGCQDSKNTCRCRALIFPIFRLLKQAADTIASSEWHLM